MNYHDPEGLLAQAPLFSTTVWALPYWMEQYNAERWMDGGVGSGGGGGAPPDQGGGGAGDEEEPEPYRAECDRSNAKNKTYLDFIDAHRADSVRIAAGLRTNAANILGLAALESTFGTSRFATEGNNFFGLHSSTKNPLPGQTGLMVARGDPNVGMAKFASFYDSAQAFAQTKGQLVVGVTDPTQFASILQHKGRFGIGPKGRPVPRYVPDLASVINDMAKRMDCDK